MTIVRQSPSGTFLNIGQAVPPNLFAVTVGQAVWQKADFTTIQEAIDYLEAQGANPLNAGTIYAHPGIYVEDLVIQSGGITIQSVGRDFGAFIDGSVVINVDPLNGCACVLQDVGVSGLVSYTGVTAAPGIHGVVLENCSIGGLTVNAGGGNGLFSLINTLVNGVVNHYSCSLQWDAGALQGAFNGVSLNSEESLTLRNVVVQGGILHSGPSPLDFSGVTLRAANVLPLGDTAEANANILNSAFRRVGTPGPIVSKSSTVASELVLDATWSTDFALLVPVQTVGPVTVVYGKQFV